jgi:hypothetical protein
MPTGTEALGGDGLVMGYQQTSCWLRGKYFNSITAQIRNSNQQPFNHWSNALTSEDTVKLGNREMLYADAACR